MAKNELEVDVDRELELNVEVMESGVVKLELTGGRVKAELGPGDRLVLVLRPLKPDENQSKPAEETWNRDTRDVWKNIGGAAPK